MKNTIFLDLQGTLGVYAKPIRTKSSTGFEKLHTLQASINSTVEQYRNTDALAINCREFWESLYSMLTKANRTLTAAEKKSDVYKEILDWYTALGNQIAFFTIRSGVVNSDYDWKAICDKFLDAPRDAEDYYLECFLQMSVFMCSVKMKNKEVALYYLKKLEKASREQLLNMADEDRASLNAKLCRFGKVEEAF